MLNMLTAATSEIDDPDRAVAELLAQLDLPSKLLKNAAGLVTCYWEFTETGVLDALARALPFEIIGTTVMGSAVPGEIGSEQLCLTVLTSDALTFATALSDPLTPDNLEDAVGACYRGARDRLGADPSLVFALTPISVEFLGDTVLEYLDRAAGGAPIFGSLSNETALAPYANARTFRGGETHRRKLALLLLGGAVKPRFFKATVQAKNRLRGGAVITDGEGHLLRAVNGVPVKDYLAGLGFSADTLNTITALIVSVDYKDGRPESVVALYASAEDGIICSGSMTAGAVITFHTTDYAGVLDTAKAALGEALDDAQKNGASALVVVSCIMRYLAIIPKTDDEMNAAAELIGDSLPYSFFYSGGELCPVALPGGGYENLIHHLTCTVMVI